MHRFFPAMLPPSLPIALLAGALAACGTPPSTSANSMTSAGSTEPAADNVATPIAPPSSPAAAAPASNAAIARSYAGRWVGVEGTYLNVTPDGPGTLSLEMQYDLDHKGVFPATVTPAGLRFTRGGETLLARRSDGDATGLKWLAGKKDCLTVNPGEGYCRD